MTLRFELPGYTGRTPRSVGAYGYGCKRDGGRVVCDYVSVHHPTPKGELVEAKAPSGKKITVEWPGLRPGVHRGVELHAVETEPAAGRD